MNVIEVRHIDTINAIEAKLTVSYDVNSEDSKAAAWAQIESFLVDHIGTRPERKER